MKEQFAYLDIPTLEKYQITSYGRIINPNGKELSPRIKKQRRKDAVYEYKVINVKNITLHVATEVYKAFGKNWTKGITIYHLDGNAENCNIDNLAISKAYTTPPSKDQIDKYISDVRPTVISCMQKKGYFERWKDGLDVDNIIGNSYLLIWQHLSQYSFEKGGWYSFCAKYVRLSFLMEVTRFCERLKKEIGFEILMEEK